ncbi:ArsR/SmtB family transcription factor [Kitasatospora sp. NPDC052896]|uniref:ArsR/SmtB family transcription factor n=1 Tax=Kitasatospora sp. NPDC052896 TaxID=3364061 RepID=UPI0037C634CC
MLRIHFTAEDLLSTRFAAGPAPLMELGLAVAMLRRPDPDPGFARWRRSLGGDAVRPVRPLLQLVPPTGAGPLFLDPPSEELDQGIEQVRSAPAEFVRAELRRICAAGLAPTTLLRHLADQDREAWQYLELTLRNSFAALLGAGWSRLRAGFDADVAWRAGVQRECGLGAMLTGLYPGVRWSGGTLEIPSRTELELRPDGAGVVLLPSAYWTGRPMVGRYPGIGALIVYPALTPLPHLPVAPGAAPAGKEALAGKDEDEPVAALLGRTRAAVLRGTTRERTTSELAAELGVGLATASEHARVLRRAGLITTLRVGRAVRHSCTPLGYRLLDRAAQERPVVPGALSTTAATAGRTGRTGGLTDVQE